MKKYILYKITRSDGEIYIGTTHNKGFDKRMTAHKKTDRFIEYTIDIDILEHSDNYEYIQKLESEYIKLFDSYHNGLNESCDGKGSHCAPNFTTKGYKYSDESRKRMSDSAKVRIQRDGNSFKGRTHTQITKNKISAAKKGKRNTSKLTKEQVIEIINIYNNRPSIEGVGVVMRNGVKMSYKQAFSLKYCNVYNVSSQCIILIIEGKSWKDVKRE